MKPHKSVDQIAQGVFNGLFARNCGIAAGGFQPGNDCAKGDGRARQLEEFSYEEMDAWRVEPVNPVRSKEHLDAIIESLSENGWQGAPVLAMAYGDGTKALTGSHRILAARQVKDEYGDSLPIPVQKIENDALELEVNGTPLWEALEGAIRDDDRADVLEQYAQEHDELREAADLMRFEVEKSDELDAAGPAGFVGR